MARTSEGAVKGTLKALFEMLGVYRVMTVTSGMGESGHPDFLACLYGLFLGIEVKATAKNRPTVLQRLRMRLLHTAGGFPFVVNADNVREFEGVLQKVKTSYLDGDTPHSTMVVAWGEWNAKYPFDE